MKLMELLRELHQGHRQCYGAARMHETLKQQGYSCSRRRINRLMREMGIKAKTNGLYAWRPGQHGVLFCNRQPIETGSESQ